MNQSRRGSLLEALISTAIGFAVALIVTLLVLPMFGFAVTSGQSFQITSIYTVVSVVRGYAVRRWFNAPPRVEHNGRAHYHVDGRGVSVYKSGISVARIEMNRDQLIGLAVDALKASREPTFNINN